MNPADASVYSDTWSAGTWTAILAVIVLMVIALMGAFIYLVHRACEAEDVKITAASSPAASPSIATTKPRVAIASRRRHRLAGHPH